jgi:hypothetical protein
VASDFAREGYAPAPALIEPALVDFLWSYALTKFASRLMGQGDALMPATPCAYGDPTFDGLLEYLRPRVEAATGLRLHPTYSFFRLYKRGDAFEPHLDRPACEISVTLNLGQTPAAPWPFHLETASGAYEARLQPGDALLYRGCDLPHWRGRYDGERVGQVFLHYVDRDGPKASFRFDGRASLMTGKTDAGA